MAKPKILFQLDPDPHPSSFDTVVAVDSDVDHVFRYGGVEPLAVTPLVHGAIFTRGPQDLHQTAIFIGGTNVAVGEQLLQQVINSFFGPMRVSVMLDANGANTTAVAAVLSAADHLDPAGCTAVVLAATGPVGRRAARLLAGAGASVRVASRSLDRAEQVIGELGEAGVATERLAAVQTANQDETAAALSGAQLLIAAGAAGVQLVSADAVKTAGVQVAIDLNAVPPVGIEGIDIMDQGADRDGVIGYGAIGVGGRKMKIHKACIRRLFERNDLVLDADQIFAMG